MAFGMMGQFSVPSSFTTPEWRRKATLPSPPASAPVAIPVRHSRPSSSGSDTSWRSSPSSTKSWQSGSPPSPTRRGCPIHVDLTLGTVFHLPLAQPDPSSVIFKELVEGDEPWGHPVVIIGKITKAGQDFVKFRTCTTFHGQHIDVAKPWYRRQTFLLADNSTDNVPHGDSELAMMAPGSARFKRRTYVNINREYTIEYHNLDAWSGPQVVFDQASTQRIIRGCLGQHQPPSWP